MTKDEVLEYLAEEILSEAEYRFKLYNETDKSRLRYHVRRIVDQILEFNPLSS